MLHDNDVYIKQKEKSIKTLILESEGCNWISLSILYLLFFKNKINE